MAVGCIMPTLRTPSSWQPFVTGLVYFITAVCAVMTSRFGGGLAFIWISNAFLMAELLTTPTRYWWKAILACSIASVLATAFFGLGPAAALPMVLVNLAELMMVVAICRSQSREQTFVGSLRPLFIFILALTVIANPIAGLAAAFVASSVTTAPFWQSWLQWYSGHVLGAMTFTPILVQLLRGEWRHWWRSTPNLAKIEVIGLLALFALIAAQVFFSARYPLMFLPMLPLVIISFRAGHMGAALAIVLLAVIGGTATTMGFGPIARLDLSDGVRVQYFQFYLAISFLLSMPVAAELSGRKRLFQMLSDSEARFRILADNSGDIVFNISSGGIIQYASPSVNDHMMIGPDALVDMPLEEIVQSADRAVVATALRRAIKHPGSVQMVEFRPLHVVHGVSWWEMAVRAILNEHGDPAGVVCTIRDMSRHKAVQQELQIAANVDTLTGAATRRAFLQRLDAEIQDLASGGKACVALIDVDHFKSVNDQYGHGVGDQALRALVACMRKGLRQIDMIGRLGGEEFAILLPRTDLSQAGIICERLRLAVEDMAVAIDNGRSIYITFSAGLVETDGGDDAASVVDAADKALYSAKRSGRNCLRLAA